MFREHFEPEELEGSLARLRPDDRRLLHIISRRGGDVSERTHIIVFLYFPVESDAVAAAAELGEHFSVERYQLDAAASWTVKGETHGSLMPPNVRAMSELCESIAQQHHGEYDGWEAALVQTDRSRKYARKLRWMGLLRRLMPWAKD